MRTIMIMMIRITIMTMMRTMWMMLFTSWRMLNTVGFLIITLIIIITLYQDCVVMRSNTASVGQWAHVGCSKSDVNFVCEQKPTC